MTIRFELHYHASYGEELCLVHDGHAEPMAWSAGDIWTLSVADPEFSLYHYELRRKGKTLREEYRGHNTDFPAFRTHHAIIRDSWHDYDDATPYLTSVISASTRAGSGGRRTALGNDETRMEVTAPFLEGHRMLAIVGNDPMLGEWTRPRRMEYVGKGRWTITLRGIRQPVEYKFVTVDSRLAITEWEEGPNRTLEPPTAVSARIYRNMVPRFRMECRVAGIAVPVFSLRRENGCGIGEFRDIKALSEWAAGCGIRLIQLLPITDTLRDCTDADSYPYSSVSAFALNPVYASLEDVLPPVSRRMDEILGTLHDMDSARCVRFGETARLKEEYLRLAYQASGEELISSREYRRFEEENSYWLGAYQAYSVLRRYFGTADTSRWGRFSRYSTGKVREIKRSHTSEFGLYGFMQYHLFRQMREAREHASRLGVALKGDLPIGVAPQSCDVWMAPSCFHMDGSAGAPPDDFSEKGQNWGFPIYDWDSMAENGYGWWRQRLKTMSGLFDAFRIDHILGFFRIWEVDRRSGDALRGEFYPSLPYSADEIRGAGYRFSRGRDIDPDGDSTNILWCESRHHRGRYFPAIAALRSPRFGSLGAAQRRSFQALYEDFYYHRNDALWRRCAERRLDAVCGCTEMTVCAEDLGMIPACVPEVLHAKRILTLEIERMPKVCGREFGVPRQYPVLSVCTTSTHDTETMRQWLSSDRKRTERYLSTQMGIRRMTEEADSPRYCRLILERHMASPSMLCIIPLQDYLAIDPDLRATDRDGERINDPADPRHVWNYRMHLTLEHLAGKRRFNALVHRIIASSNR